jgi:quercetin dioxygenase-like cupin family protein
MSTPVTVPPRGGEIIGDAADRRVEILADHDGLHATWSRFGAGRAGADLHVHRQHTDLFYVLDGELTVRLGLDGERVVARAGTLVRIPPMVVHGFRNASDADVRYLNFHAPGMGFAGYLRGLRDGQAPSYDQHDPPPGGGQPIAGVAVVRGGETVAEQPGIRVALLADVDAIAVAETHMEPDAAVATPAHVHAGHQEWLYVLDGEATLAAGHGELRATAGTWVHVPAGVEHALEAAGADGARLLTVHAPGGVRSGPLPA